MNHQKVSVGREYYALGLPVKTELGYCHHLLVRDYPLIVEDLKIVSLTKNYFLNMFLDSKNKVDKEIIDKIKEMELVEIVLSFEDVKESYEKVINHFFKEEMSEVFSRFSSVEQFYSIRRLILDLAFFKEEDVNPNPEIQRAIDRSRRIKEMERGKLEFSDIISSVSVYTGKSYEDIKNMTVYQLYLDYYRIAKFFAYGASTLFATVAPDVKIEDWGEHIDLFKEEKEGLSRQEFDKVASIVRD